MVKQPVTVCYPQEKLTAPERLRGHIVNDMDVCICCGMCGECIESCPKHCLTMDTARTPVAADKTPTVETKPE